MKQEKKVPETLDSLFATENEHWNVYAYALHCKATEGGLFAEPRTPLQLVNESIEGLQTQLDTPAKAVETVLTLLTNAGLTPLQRLFVLKGIDGYLEITEFDEGNFDTVQELLQSHAKRLQREATPPKPLVKKHS